MSITINIEKYDNLLKGFVLNYPIEVISNNLTNLLLTIIIRIQLHFNEISKKFNPKTITININDKTLNFQNNNLYNEIVFNSNYGW